MFYNKAHNWDGISKYQQPEHLCLQPKREEYHNTSK